MQLTTFIFDLDDVLCRYDKAERIAHLAQVSGVSPDLVHDRIWGSGFEDDADIGVYPDSDSYLAAFGEHLGYPLTRQQWIDARKTCIKPDKEMLTIVAELRRIGQIAILTNNVPLLAETLDEVFPGLSGVFGRNIFFSCHLRLGKPEPEIYRKVAELLGVNTPSCLFADDKRENAEGAERAGMVGVHFVGAAQFAERLRELDIAI